MAHRRTRSSLPQKLTGDRPGYDHDSSLEESAVRTSPTAVSCTTPARKTTRQVGASTARYTLRSSSKRPSVATPTPSSTSTSVAEGAVVQLSCPQTPIGGRNMRVASSTTRYTLRSSSTPSAEVQVSSPQSNMTIRGQEQDITRVTPIISGQTAESGEK